MREEYSKVEGNLVVSDVVAIVGDFINYAIAEILALLPLHRAFHHPP